MPNKRGNPVKTVVKSSVGYLWREIWSYKKLYYIVYCSDILIKTAIPFINLYIPKFIIDELLGERNVKRLAFYTIWMIALNILLPYLQAITNEYLSKVYHDDFTRYFEALLGKKIMKMDFENTESKAVLERAEKAKNGLSWAGGVAGINGTLSSILTSLFTVIGIIGVMVTGPWPLLILVLINVVCNAFMNKKSNQIARKYFGKFSELNRPFSYIFYKLSDIRYAKDIRLYEADTMMLEHADSYNKRIARVYKNQSNESIKYHAGVSLVTILRNSLSFLYLGYQVIGRRITIGDFTMYINAGDTFGTAADTIIAKLQDLIQKSFYLNEYVNFMQIPDHKDCGTQQIPEQMGHRIEFRNVSFQYPQSDKMILKDVNITVEDGEHLAIVGLNGAGKTTFVKLLCRLYDVTSGEILLDGKNIKEFEYEEYMKLLAVVFQDFKLLAFSALENILLEKEEYDKERLMQIMEQVNLKDKFDHLPEGIDTPIFRYFDAKGVELSGGEQQKLAIARALYKDAPIVILDEPTAALDPKAESEIYEQFNQMVGGKTAFYISHRLSSCKFCDKIAVFSEGTIMEYGTHEELVQMEQGIYAQLYLLQAQYYQ